MLEKISEKAEGANNLLNQAAKQIEKNVQTSVLKAQEMRQLALETLVWTTNQKADEWFYDAFIICYMISWTNFNLKDFPHMLLNDRVHDKKSGFDTWAPDI